MAARVPTDERTTLVACWPAGRCFGNPLRRCSVVPQSEARQRYVQTRVKGDSMRGHIRRRGSASFEYIVDVGSGPGATLRGLQQALLAGAQAQGLLPGLWRQAARDRGAPPRHQGRLCQPQGGPGGDGQGDGGSRGEKLRRAEQADGARVPHQGVAAGDRSDGAADDLPLLRAARAVPHRAPHRFAARWRRCSGQPSTPSTPSSPAKASATASAVSRPARCITSMSACTAPSVTPCAGVACFATRSMPPTRPGWPAPDRAR